MKFIDNLKKRINKNNRNVFYITLDGVAAIMALNVFQPFVQMLGKHLGVNDFQIGLLNSLPALASIFVLIPGAVLIEKYDNKKTITIKLVFATSLFYILISIIPFIHSSIKTWIYVAVIGLISVPFSIFNTSWQSFFSDVFNDKTRNYAFAERNKYSTFIGLIITLASGQILANIPKTDAQRINIYQIFALMAFIFYICEIYFLYKVDSNNVTINYGKEKKHKFTLPSFDEVKVNKRYITYTLTSFIYYISWQMGWPLFFIFQVDYLHANEAWLAINNVAGAITSFLSFSIWNKIISKKGNSFVLIIAAAGIAINPILFVASTNLYVLAAVSALIGVFGAALTLTLFNNLLEVIPNNSKTAYIAYYNTLMGISGFLSPLLGVWLYKATSIYVAMNVIGVLRFIGTYIFYLRYKNENEKRKSKLKQFSSD